MRLEWLAVERSLVTEQAAGALFVAVNVAHAAG